MSIYLAEEVLDVIESRKRVTLSIEEFKKFIFDYPDTPVFMEYYEDSDGDYYTVFYIFYQGWALTSYIKGKLELYEANRLLGVDDV